MQFALWNALPICKDHFTFRYQLLYVPTNCLIVDAYKHEIQPCSFSNYILFVIYFPQLVAGPIVHYQEMMPQFGAQKSIRWDLIWEGLFIFICGLFKKIVIADKLAVFVQQGYSNVEQIGFLGAWLLSLSYTFQLYFDFSGYADMAIGSGLFFGIRLPENFNSPYKALDIQDFWRRWHITLSTWLKNYIYIPLGGSHCTLLRTCINLFLTFFIGGVWHGAGWTFILWGTFHGLATVIHRLWRQTGLLCKTRLKQGNAIEQDKCKSFMYLRWHLIPILSQLSQTITFKFVTVLSHCSCVIEGF